MIRWEWTWRSSWCSWRWGPFTIFISAYKVDSLCLSFLQCASVFADDVSLTIFRTPIRLLGRFLGFTFDLPPVSPLSFVHFNEALALRTYAQAYKTEERSHFWVAILSFSLLCISSPFLFFVLSTPTHPVPCQCHAVVYHPIFCWFVWVQTVLVNSDADTELGYCTRISSAQSINTHERWHSFSSNVLFTTCIGAHNCWCG